MPGLLRAAVSPALLDQHPDLQDLAFEAPGHAVDIVSVPEAPALERPGTSLLRAGMGHRQMLRDLAVQHNPEHLFLLYLDHAQLALATQLHLPHSVRLSGLLFRPSFHYERLESDSPSLAEQLLRLRKRLVLRAALRHPNVDSVLTLDPTAVAAIQAMNPRVRIGALPDPVEPGVGTEPPLALRTELGVAPGRKLALLFGALAERKGVLQLLDALALLPPETAGNLSVVLAGRVVEPALYPAMAPRIAALESNPVQLIVSDSFVPDERIQSLVRAADLILLPYQRHVGSSGVLVRAAAAERPALAQEYGLVGYQTRTHKLGQAVDTTSPQAIAEALGAFVAAPARAFDPSAARAFAAQNTVGAYLDAFFGHLFPEASA